MPKALLCVTVTAATTAELRAKRDEVAGADLVELRLDTVSDPNVAGALAGRRLPVVVTCRPHWEGGFFTGSEDERRRILAEALARGAEFVDIEWRARFDELIAQSGGRRVVLSMHDFGGVPDDLREQARAMRATGAEVVKIAVQPRKLSECVPLRDLAADTGRHGGFIVLAMGPFGAITRVLAARFGSMWTYAGAIKEIGQISAQSLVKEYQFGAVSDRAAIYGIVGRSVEHSVSPAMHNAAFRALGLDAVYLPLPAVDADDFVTFGRAFAISGASVTIPHKVSLFDHVDEIYPTARRIGAINTIRVVNGRWIGGNSDATGFLEPLQDSGSLKEMRASVLGAGGAARAVTVALASTGCRVTLHARRRAQAEALSEVAPVEIGPWPPARGSWDLLVNCTPAGMYPNVDESPVPADHLTGRVVYDLIYNPPLTRLLRDATSAGCQTIGGLEMLVAQAKDQIRWWTATRPPAGVMREAALKRLAEFVRDEHHVV